MATGSDRELLAHQSTVLIVVISAAVSVSFIVILLLSAVLLVLYYWRKKKQKTESAISLPLPEIPAVSSSNSDPLYEEIPASVDNEWVMIQDNDAYVLRHQISH